MVACAWCLGLSNLYRYVRLIGLALSCLQAATQKKFLYMSAWLRIWVGFMLCG
jgi:hypothetical protein